MQTDQHKKHTQIHSHQNNALLSSADKLVLEIEK